MPPDKAEMEGVLVWRWNAAAGGPGADWLTCLHLLERAAAAANIARGGVATTAALSMPVGGVSLHSGQQTEQDKKLKKIFAFDGHRLVFQTQQQTKNMCMRRRR